MDPLCYASVVARTSRLSELLAVPLDARAAVPLQRQLYEGLRDAIAAGRLKPGARLPSTRRFAEALRISRNTALYATQILHQEGYVVSRRGSGTYVADVLPERFQSSAAVDAPRLKTGPRSTHLSDRGTIDVDAGAPIPGAGVGPSNAIRSRPRLALLPVCRLGALAGLQLAQPLCIQSVGQRPCGLSPPSRVDCRIPGCHPKPQGHRRSGLRPERLAARAGPRGPIVGRSQEHGG